MSEVSVKVGQQQRDQTLIGVLAGPGSLVPRPNPHAILGHAHNRVFVYKPMHFVT